VPTYQYAAHDLGRDAPTLPVAARLRVDKERVVAAIPRDGDEADQHPVRGTRGHPNETPWLDPIPPPSDGVASVGVDEFHQIVVSQCSSPRVDDLRIDDDRVAHQLSLVPDNAGS
jgi:hypothetical protein